MAVWIIFSVAVLVSATTPLAIQWSEQGLGLFFAVTIRMSLGTLICLGLIHFSRIALPFHDRAIRAYLLGGFGFFVGITCSYWGLQLIPSGWASVLFGLTPMFNGFIAKRALQEPFGWNRIIGSLLGLMGLMIIFSQGIRLNLAQNGLGVVIVMLSVIVFSLTSVGMKKWSHDLHPLAITTGCLMVMTPCFFMSWYWGEGGAIGALAPKTVGSILYLACFSTVAGFVAFYSLLRRVDAAVAALPNFLAPLLGVWLGVVVNGESLQPGFLLGAVFVLTGLSLFQWGKLLFAAA
ncbi:MAG: EamA family transporter [Magnetococcales bacterium]|nr:EamA family transporter [Magnetococcales bacterium]